MKGVLRFGKKGKLSPRHIGSYEILARIGPVAYRLALPPSLVGVHDVFHVSILRKYIVDLAHVLTQELPELSEDLTYVEEPVKILERNEQNLRNHVVSYIKVRLRNHSDEEASWERESETRAMHPHLFNMIGFDPALEVHYQTAIGTEPAIESVGPYQD
ncbi:uncharacterized protein LOC122665523 [Telopea speciosissima]|uniref:uncharacterized protein LOC122665523 n=1 Tax=Telopea speciosissima TaxID=54955 RepID=UPI001CC76543|nr:uncharacterized protein LOC122665523 [Telopea speciosissima]